MYLINDSYYCEKKIRNPKTILASLDNFKKKSKDFNGMMIIKDTALSTLKGDTITNTGGYLIPQEGVSISSQPYHSPS